MLYSREIEDSVLIQLIILFTLQKTAKAITHSQLEDLVLGSCNINFINYNLAISNLINIDHIRNFPSEGGVPMYEITEKGSRSIGFFESKVPIYIREPIENSIAPMFKRERLKKSIKGEIMPLNENEFMADCALYENNKPLMTLSFYAGTREEAAKIVKHFKNNPDVVYQSILHALLPENSDTEQ
ncbi:MAG: DUF4364 family protein [Clostridia bacterium]|nr:DUF4364 family protein [Clostridia bacterium]